MIDLWTGSVAARRIEALERDVALLRAMVADQPPPPEDPRIERIVAMLADVSDRLTAAENLMTKSAKLIADQAASIISDAEQAQLDRKDLAKLRVEMIRLEREFTRHEDEMKKIAIGLLERMDLHRVPRADAERQPLT